MVDSIGLVIACIVFFVPLGLRLLGLDHTHDFDGQRVVHQVRDEVLSDQLGVLAYVVEVWVLLFLPNLSFKGGLIRVDPFVLSHCFEAVLFWDVSRAFQGQFNSEVLSNTLTQGFILQDVQRCCFIVVKYVEVDGVLLHTVFYTFGVDDWRFVLGRVDQVEHGEEENEDTSDLMPAVGDTPTEGFSIVFRVILPWLATLFEILEHLLHVEVDDVGKGVTWDDTRLLLVCPILVDSDNDP